MGAPAKVVKSQAARIVIPKEKGRGLARVREAAALLRELEI
jgi:hypothetical protein